MILQCPTCSQSFETTIEILNAHVASHYEDVVDPLSPGSMGEEESSGSGSSSFKRKRSEDSELAGTSNHERRYMTAFSGKP
jgi:transcription elongation factor Elf1